jgi:hypothetical protein
MRSNKNSNSSSKRRNGDQQQNSSHMCTAPDKSNRLYKKNEKEKEDGSEDSRSSKTV